MDELDYRDDGQYWLTDSNLVVEDSVVFSSEPHSAHSALLRQEERHRESLVAVDRLKGYNYLRIRYLSDLILVDRLFLGSGSKVRARAEPSRNFDKICTLYCVGYRPIIVTCWL